MRFAASSLHQDVTAPAAMFIAASRCPVVRKQQAEFAVPNAPSTSLAGVLKLALGLVFRTENSALVLALVILLALLLGGVAGL